MKEISEKCLFKIKESKIRPIPRYFFFIRGFFLWTLIFLLLTLSSVSIGSVLHGLINNDWDIYLYLNYNLLFRVFHCVPYFWFGLSVMSLLLVWLNFKQTRSGYCYRNRIILITCSIIGTILGLTIYQTGLGTEISDEIEPYLPTYWATDQRLINDWMHPENGLLIGQIELIDQSNNTMVIKDFRGNTWQVNLLTQTSSLEKSSHVKLIGQKKDSDVFQAKEVRTWNFIDR